MCAQMNASRGTSIVILYNEAYNQIQLVDKFNVSQSTVSRALSRHAETGMKSKSPGKDVGSVIDPKLD